MCYELTHLRLFHVLALQGAFTKAAESLHISQPALSVQMKKALGAFFREPEPGIISPNKCGKRTPRYYAPHPR
ncbi:helix-turn-helix domain-containing protein [Candidatus Formimonas warabiya]|uniref:HTH lysR-type domain-containing protein n=1 Tax=Formimonas warabiya TaxID=1761012 RepID=A0A3G1KPI3_FORW1|nr:LysR family transcriptional regulator [Candidatus Formimonas warabiya]ATW24357.1 hypothetical protein DCMF_05765 [Candidatus Formimonas warabiya]